MRESNLDKPPEKTPAPKEEAANAAPNAESYRDNADIQTKAPDSAATAVASLLEEITSLLKEIADAANRQNAEIVTPKARATATTAEGLGKSATDYAKIAKREADAAGVDRDKAKKATSKEKAVEAAISAEAHRDEARSQANESKLAAATAVDLLNSITCAISRQNSEIFVAKAWAAATTAALDAERAGQAAIKARQIADTAEE